MVWYAEGCVTERQWPVCLAHKKMHININILAFTRGGGGLGGGVGVTDYTWAPPMVQGDGEAVYT